MKATFGVLLLCLAYACSAAVDNKTPDLEKLVEGQKIFVEGIRVALIESHKNIIKDIEAKLDENKKEAKKDMKTIIDAGHKDIIERYEISEHKNSKEVKLCFDKAEIQFVDVEKKVNHLADVCYRQATISSDAPLNNLIHLAEDTKAVTNELDAVISKCKDTDNAKMQKCVESELAEIKSTKIEPFSVKAQLLQNIAKKSIEATFKGGKVCKIAVFNSVQEFVFGLTGIRTNAALCIWVAEPSLPSA